MNIDLLQILYKIIMIILAFFTAVVITKTLSKYMKWDEKMKQDETNGEGISDDN
jgi:membrane protein YdbS with pleckstrin-like domain